MHMWGDAFVISLPSGLSSAICLEIVGKTSFHPAGNGSTAFFMHCLSHTLISNRHASVALFEFIAFLIIRLGLVHFWVGWLQSRGRLPFYSVFLNAAYTTQG